MKITFRNQLGDLRETSQVIECKRVAMEGCYLYSIDGKPAIIARFIKESGVWILQDGSLWQKFIVTD